MIPALKYALVVPGWQFGGGVPRAAETFLHLAQEAGYDVTIVDLATSRSDPHSSRLIKPQTWLDRTRLVHQGSNPSVIHAGSTFAEVELLRYRQRSELRGYLSQFDLVQMVAGAPAWALALRGIGPPVVLQVATSIRTERASRDAVGSPLTRAYRRSMTRAVAMMEVAALQVPDHTFVLNREMLWRVCSQVADPGTVSLLPPGIDTEFFHPGPGGWTPRGHLVSVGRLDEERKGWDRLIRCYRRLRDTDSDSPQLRLIGNGTLSTQNSNLIHDLGLTEHIVVSSDLSDRQIAVALRSASVFVTLPHEEGLGIAALEGMASGLPVVAADTAGSREYVQHGQTGFLLEQTIGIDPDAFVAAVQDVWHRTGESMSKDARDLCVQRYSSVRIAPAIAETYARVLGQVSN